jgi:hypothetical protein
MSIVHDISTIVNYTQVARIGFNRSWVNALVQALLANLTQEGIHRPCQHLTRRSNP